MSPILGIWASGQQPALNATSYESIATVTGDGSATSLSFTSIPGTYKHLQIRYSAQANGVDRLFMRFNSDSAQNYASHNLIGDGANTSTNVSTTSAQMGWAGYLIDSNSSSITAGGIIDILDYTSTNKNKVIRTLSGFDKNGSGTIGFASGLWFATPAAITSITLFPQNSVAWSSNTKFALYGVKG